MAAGFNERQRNLEWWREEGEVPGDNRLTEKYEQANFGPGWDGVGAPPSKDMGSGYAKNNTQGRNYDPLRGKKTTSGKGFPNENIDGDDFKEKAKKAVKAKLASVKEAFGDDEFQEEPYDDAGLGGGEGGFEDNDVPTEFGDEDLEGGEDFGGDEGTGTVPEDITVEVDGQQFKLTPVGPEEGEEFGNEGEFGGEDEFGDELGGPGDEFGDENEFGGEDEELGRHGGVKAEAKDVTHEQRGGRVSESTLDKVVEAAVAKVRGNKMVKPNKVQKEAAIKNFIKLKNYSEAKLKELFTGEYVLNDQGLVGFDFSDVAGDANFAVVARAASGDQYSPTISSSVWEPGKDSKGGKTAHAKVVESAKDEFARWIKVQEDKIKESETTNTSAVDNAYGSEANKDPGEASSNFNQKDTLKANTPGGRDDASTWAAIPEIVGNDDQVLSQYGNEKTYSEAAKTRALRRQQESTETKVKIPSKETKEKIENNLNESFDFRDFLAGKYGQE